MNKERRQIRPDGRPFWLPASSFYFLALAIAVGIFFLTWAILAEAKEESPWIAAGLMASVSMIAAVVVREVILRYRRNTVFLAQRRLDNSLRSFPVPVKTDPDVKKLTLDQNRILLSEIKRKSEAAKVLDHLADSHREVFALCAQYISVATSEIPRIGVGSPRLAAIKKGRDWAERVHRHHMMRWAELEVGALSELSESDEIGLRLDGARRALKSVRSALAHYPNQIDLVNSKAAIEDFIESARIAEVLENAKRAELRGDIETALLCLAEANEMVAGNPGLEDIEHDFFSIAADVDRLKRKLRG